MAGLDLMQTTGRVVAEYEALPRPSSPRRDPGGQHRPGGWHCRPIAGAGLAGAWHQTSPESPSMGDTYMNLRSELWFKCKGLAGGSFMQAPKDDQLLAELTAIGNSFTSSGKMKAESKDEMRKRGLGSPDLADALCLTMASDAITAQSGSFKMWRGELRRNLQGIA